MGSTYGNVLDGFDGLTDRDRSRRFFYQTGCFLQEGKEEALRAQFLFEGDPSCAPARVALGVLRTPAHRGNPTAASPRDSQSVIECEGMRESRSEGHDTEMVRLELTDQVE